MNSTYCNKFFNGTRTAKCNFSHLPLCFSHTKIDLFLNVFHNFIEKIDTQHCVSLRHTVKGFIYLCCEMITRIGSITSIFSNRHNKKNRKKKKKIKEKNFSSR